MATLPEALVPFVNSVGEQLRARRLLRQLPPHDHETRYCGQLSPAEQVELQTFSARRKRETLGRGYVRPLPAALTHTLCAECGVACRPGDLAVFVVPAHSSAVWHPACFTCGVCHELLVDLIYFQHAGRVFCGRHHAEQIKPRCAACDEVSTDASSHFNCYFGHLLLLLLLFIVLVRTFSQNLPVVNFVVCSIFSK